jgi:hypothetical protein
VQRSSGALVYNSSLPTSPYRNACFALALQTFGPFSATITA